MKVSIIIPVYNTGERLQRCLDSVIGQTFTDFECIVVDDGSTDNSPRVIDEYAEKDARFVSIHKKNGGVSSARNFGLDKAQGEWVVFLDSDDFFKENHLEVLLSAVNGNVDLVFTGYVDVCQDNQNKTHSYLGELYVGVDEIRTFITQTDVISYMIPWDKMFRRSLIEANHIRFDKKLALSEDRLFCYECLLHVCGIMTISDITYIHDASDKNSLSYRQYPASQNAYRFQVFVKPTNLLIDRYALTLEESFEIWKYLWSLFELTLLSMYDVRKNIFIATKRQKAFYNSQFCKTLYAKMKDTASVKSYFQNRQRQMILEKDFFKVNAKHFWQYVRFKLH